MITEAFDESWKEESLRDGEEEEGGGGIGGFKY